MTPQNIYANETPPRLMSHNADCDGNHSHNPIMTPEAERFNGWMAMLGFSAALGAYVTTGQIIPGIF